MIHHYNRSFHHTADARVFSVVTYCGMQVTQDTIADPANRIVAVDAYYTDETTDDGEQHFCLGCNKAMEKENVPNGMLINGAVIMSDDDDDAPSNYLTDEAREELGAEIDAATPPMLRRWIPTSDVVDYVTATAWLETRHYATSNDAGFLTMDHHQTCSLMAYISGYASSVVPGEDAAAVCSRISLLLDAALTMGRE